MLGGYRLRVYIVIFFLVRVHPLRTLLEMGGDVIPLKDRRCSNDYPQNMELWLRVDLGGCLSAKLTQRNKPILILNEYGLNKKLASNIF